MASYQISTQGQSFTGERGAPVTLNGPQVQTTQGSWNAPLGFQNTNNSSQVYTTRNVVQGNSTLSVGQNHNVTVGRSRLLDASRLKRSKVDVYKT